MFYVFLSLLGFLGIDVGENIELIENKLYSVNLCGVWFTVRQFVGGLSLFFEREGEEYMLLPLWKMVGDLDVLPIYLKTLYAFAREARNGASPLVLRALVTKLEADVAEGYSDYDKSGNGCYCLNFSF